MALHGMSHRHTHAHTHTPQTLARCIGYCLRIGKDIGASGAGEYTCSEGYQLQTPVGMDGPDFSASDFGFQQRNSDLA